jgi:hypothetical protein
LHGAQIAAADKVSSSKRESSAGRFFGKPLPWLDGLLSKDKLEIEDSRPEADLSDEELEMLYQDSLSKLRAKQARGQPRRLASLHRLSAAFTTSSG